MDIIDATAPVPAIPVGTTTPRRAAIVAGVGYLALFVLAIFANFFVLDGLVVTGDPATTFDNVAAAPTLFRGGLVAFLAVFLIDVAVAWALYVVFRPVRRDLSLLAAWFRLTYTAFLGVALVFFFVVLELTSGAGFLAAIDPGALQAQTMLALDAFEATWLIGLTAFGLHLVVVGYLLVKSGRAPRALGWALAVAGVAYLADTTAVASLADYAEHADLFLAMVAIPSVVAELWFAGWLLARGGTDQASTNLEPDRSHPGPWPEACPTLTASLPRAWRSPRWRSPSGTSSRR